MFESSSTCTFGEPASCGSYLFRSARACEEPPSELNRTVVTGSRGLPSALPAHLPQDACGLRRYEPDGQERITPLRGKFVLTRQGISLDTFLSGALRRLTSLAKSSLHVAMQSGPSLHPKHSDVRRMASEDSVRVSATSLSC